MMVSGPSSTGPKRTNYGKPGNQRSLALSMRDVRGKTILMGRYAQRAGRVWFGGLVQIRAVWQRKPAYAPLGLRALQLK